MEDKLLTFNEVRDIVSLSRTQITRMMLAARFPAAVRLSEKRLAWLESDVIRWLKELKKIEVKK